MTKIRIKLILIGVLLILLLIGCAGEYKIDLSYERIVNARGGSGEILIAKPKDEIPMRPSGQYIIGTYRINVREIDIITDTNISDWVVSALEQELSASGYKPKMVLELPGNVSKGINIIISKVYLEKLTKRAEGGFPEPLIICDIELIIEIWKDGVKVRSLNIESAGDKSEINIFTTSWKKEREIAAQEALQHAMQQAIPEIIKTLEY